MERNWVPTRLQIEQCDAFEGENEITFVEINHLFASLEYGRILAEQMRYDRYQLSGDELGEPVFSDEEWEKLLGSDVNNFRHNVRTFELTRWFISGLEEPLSDEEAQLMMLAASVHDWAEAVTGDINYDLKTDKQEEEEGRELEKILTEVFGEQNTELIDQVLPITHRSADSKLGKMFDAVEQVGYAMTGLRAWKAAKELDDPEKIDRLQYLAGGVLGNHVYELIKLSYDYEPINEFFSVYEDEITDVMNNLDISMFARDEDPNPQRSFDRFKRSTIEWQNHKEFMNQAA